MAKKPTKTLEIIAYLQDGRFVSDDGILMFDSILYHAWFYKHAPHVLRGEHEDIYDGHIGLPLMQLPGNRWAASKGIYEETAVQVEYYSKRPDFLAADKIRKLNQKSGIISDSVGKFRAYRNPVIVRTIKNATIKFYARGHADKITDMLSTIPGIGKKTAMGWGIVTKWEINEISADYSLWHPEYGLMRPLPVDESTDIPFDVSDYPIINYGVKPPYWKSQNMKMCYVPIRNI